MPHSIWTGAINFGMVNMPVKLYSATENKDLSLHLVHSLCGTRIKEYKWCPSCDRKVEWSEIERGYEYAKGKYVKLSADDFEKLPLPSKHTVAVSSFVKQEEIDPIYYERSYFLEADQGAEKPFALFMRTLTDKGMVAVASIAIRNKERLCALRPVGSILILNTLLYADEIRVSLDTKLPAAKISKPEIEMAYHLVDLMSQPFNPQEYKDHYRAALQSLIDAKLEGVELTEESKPKRAKVVNLMDALRASLEKAEGTSATTSKTSKRRHAMQRTGVNAGVHGDAETKSKAKLKSVKMKQARAS